MRRKKDITGQRFGKLVAISFSHLDKFSAAYWKCKCDCGGEAIIRGSCLRTGKAKSCGCISKNKKKYSKVKLINKKFTRLLVIDFSHLDKRGNHYWLCRCDCGVEKNVRESCLISGEIKSCGCYKKDLKRLEMIALNKKRFKNYSYLTPINTRIRQSQEYKHWRSNILKIDKYTCNKCGQIGGKLEVHHILNFSEYPDLRFNTDNGITMCKDCHRKFHYIYGNRKNNEKQLEEFLK